MDTIIQPLIKNLAFIPMAIIIYLPMKKQIKGGYKELFIKASVAALISIICSTFITFALNIDNNISCTIMLCILFYFYHLTVNVDLPKKLLTFLTAVALLTYSSTIAIICDAILHPHSDIYNFSIEAGVIEFGILIVLIAFILPVFLKYYIWLINNYNISKIWMFVSLAPIIFIAINIIMQPHYYENIYVGRIQEVYFFVFFILLITGLFIYILFYLIARSAYENAELEKRNQLLSIQSNQYESLIQHVDDMRSIRHDFRHQMRTVYGLAQEEDCPMVKEFLSKYIENTSTSIKKYCENTSVNSIVGYYFDIAQTNNIKLNYKIILSKNLLISETDFCAMLGNLLENAIHACLEIPSDQRYMSITIANTNLNNIALSVKNSYSGNIVMDDKKFLSTKHNGKGIGLESIKATVQKYNGAIKFNPTDKEFVVEIILFTA